MPNFDIIKSFNPLFTTSLRQETGFGKEWLTKKKTLVKELMQLKLRDEAKEGKFYLAEKLVISFYFLLFGEQMTKQA